MKISKKLRAFRTEQKLTLKELSEKSGISLSFISDIENDRRTPSIEKLKTLASALGVPASEFLEESNPNNKINNPDFNKEKNAVSKITDIKEAMEIILSQPGLMLNGKLLSDESKIALANAIKMGLAYAEQQQEKEKLKDK
ncbi:Helix-turn-helix domain-containing protein [Clostridium acidisoli DSM 12555]|uniref:Helix-turn-helix domain-containing protein n=1 Tax=Clostridium acidisoli DSM 12555 TaxID=1121291 RepID=A0A1W1X007_9CLOT|nr:helix-turn-helix transcriptional regulator [Clostridium acidisoli]SMC17312.1 Helix-turn-helix domain-containing protein [Clostridium acidisoli DSM 12555]